MRRMQKDDRIRQAFERTDPSPHPVYTVVPPPDQVGRNEDDLPSPCPLKQKSARVAVSLLDRTHPSGIRSPRAARGYGA